MASKSKKIQKVIDGIRAWNLSSSSSSTRAEIEETLKSEHFKFGHIVQYGFPNEPSCIAYDPIQRILAIGTKNGSGRLFGRPGVDHHFQQPSNCPIIQILFLVNQGTFLTVCGDETIHQWNYQSKPTELTHSLQFKRERLTCAYLSTGARWLYVGTERGNVLFVNVQNFVISGYVINWNKAIDLSQNSHPGSVIQLADNPSDSNKLLIGYSTGFLSLWNLKEKNAKLRFKFNEPLCGFCWYPDGKTFMTCHNGGYLVTWNARQAQSPLSVNQPHNRDNTVDSKTTYEPIKKVILFATKAEELITVFSGGTPKNEITDFTESSSHSFSSVSVMKDKRLTILQMDYPVIDFAQLCDSCYTSTLADPFGIAILLENDLMVIDLLSPNYPSFENPYPIDLHVSPVSCIHYVSDCPGDFVAALYTAKPRTKRQPHNKGGSTASSHEWPINGGQWGSLLNSHSELIITGHDDGSVRFWDATGTLLTSLYKFRLTTYLEKVSVFCSNVQPSDNVKTNSNLSTPTLSNNSSATAPGSHTHIDDCGRPCSAENSLINANVIPLVEESQLSITHIQICPDSRKLMLAGNYFATILSFTKREVISDVPILDSTIVYEVPEDADLITEDYGINKQTGLPRQPSGGGSGHGPDESDLRVYVGVKPGLIKWAPGYQPDLVCRLGSYTKDSPSSITSIGFNATYGLMAYGNDQGIAIVDFVQKICLMSSGTPDLYGSNDPYNRISWSSNNRKDDSKCPTVDDSNIANGCVSSANAANSSDQASDSGISKSGSTKGVYTSKSELRRGKSQGALRTFLRSVLLMNFSETTIFSRSCSSSTSSLENISCEAITAIAFGETYSRKGDVVPKPCLWIGTSLGSTIVINLNLPDLRTTQPVIVSPSGSIYRMRGSILCIAYLDSNGDLLTGKALTGVPEVRSPALNSSSSSSIKEALREMQNSSNSPNTPTSATCKKPTYVSKQSTMSSGSSNFVFTGSSGSSSSMNDSNIDSSNDAQYAIICSEKNAEVISLPSQNPLYKIKITETSVALKASVITLKSSPCLVSFIANGHLMAFSLPSLRLLMDFDSVLGDNWIENTLFFANNGLSVYMSSASEMEKITYSSEFTNNIKNAQGDLFITRDMPCPPKKGFFETFFNNPVPVDLDDILGEAGSGKASTATATLLTSKMDRAHQGSANAQSEIAKARMAAIERGEKLSETELKTAEMMEHAKMFSKTASQLAAKYERKEKRWGLPF